MTRPDIDNLKYPAGKFNKPEKIDPAMIQVWVKEIEAFPTILRKLTHDLTTEQLNWRYRPNGWTIKQVVHHCADSHMNSVTRFKLSLTEDSPEIKPFFEDRWAELPDSLDDDISYSLTLLSGLHDRWVKLLRSLTNEDLAREFIHPEYGQRFNLAETIGNYAWHGRHHLAHIEQALKHEGKFD